MARSFVALLIGVGVVLTACAPAAGRTGAGVFKNPKIKDVDLSKMIDASYFQNAADRRIGL